MAEYKYDNPQLTESFKNHMNEVFGTNSRVKKIIKNKTVIQEKKGQVK